MPPSTMAAVSLASPFCTFPVFLLDETAETQAHTTTTPLNTHAGPAAAHRPPTNSANRAIIIVSSSCITASDIASTSTSSRNHESPLRPPRTWDEESSSASYHRATDAGTSRLLGTTAAANGGMRMGMGRADDAEPELKGGENSDAGRKVDAVSELLWIALPDPEFLAAARDLEACRDPWRRARRLAFRARGNARWCGMSRIGFTKTKTIKTTVIVGSEVNDGRSSRERRVSKVKYGSWL
ncbi:hypothetical protein K438DRAFT_2023089 [Mycena galopus ATCC 62051]|nr:hypothetical protein K438DRAFT_2023089 [Mycena galopus ATCC 62051]